MTNPDNVGGLPELPAWMSDYTIPNDAFEVGKDVRLSDRMRAYGELCRAAPAGGEPNGKLVGWWNGITPGFDGMGMPSIRWGADAEDSRHDIPLYDGYNPIHYVTPVSAPAGSGEVLTADAATLIRAKIHEWRTDALEIRESDHAHRNLIAEEYEAHADELEVLLAKKASPINGGAMVTDAMVAAAYDHLCGAGIIEDAGTVADDMKIMRAALEAALLRKLQQGAE